MHSVTNCPMSTITRPSAQKDANGHGEDSQSGWRWTSVAARAARPAMSSAVRIRCKCYRLTGTGLPVMHVHSVVHVHLKCRIIYQGET